MTAVILLLLMAGGLINIGYGHGVRTERRRHTRAVTEAQDNITTMRQWRDR
jgi:hypothetical protein